MHFLHIVLILQLFSRVSILIKAQRLGIDTEEQNCSKVITGETEGTVSSPGYPEYNYKPSTSCTYTIMAPPNNVIVYIGTHMDLEEPDPVSGLCIYDNVNVFDGDLLSNTFCAKQPVYLNATTTDRLEITFRSDFTTERSGFEIEWKVLDPAERKITLNCNFDQAIPLCAGWTNQNSAYSWFFTREYTPSANTGPISDHTTGSAEGRYAYIEGSKATRNSAALLKSPMINSDNKPDKRCLTFWYHMYGKGIGGLRVFLVDNNNQTTILTDLHGPKGAEWLREEVTIIPHSHTKSFEIMFEATRGLNYMSDIAIDDISISVGICTNEMRTTDLNVPGMKETSTSTAASTTVSVDCPLNLQRCGEDCDLTCETLKEEIICSHFCNNSCGCPSQSPVLLENRCEAVEVCGLLEETTTSSPTTTMSKTTTFETTTKPSTDDNYEEKNRMEREKEKIHGRLLKLILDAVHSAIKNIPNQH